MEAYSGDETFFFVCYSHTDKDTVYPEMQWLHEAGVRLWYDEGIEVGTTWRQALAEALDKAGGVIFMCSRESLASSHCRKELSYALDHDRPILVVRLDDTELPPELALYLNDTQLLERAKYSSTEYRQKLLSALNRLGTSGVAPYAARPEASRNPRKFAIVSTVLMALAVLGAAWLVLPFGDDVSESVSGPEPNEIRFPTVAIMPMEVLTDDDVLHYLARASEEDLRGRMQASVYEPVNVPDAALDMSVTEIGQEYGVGFVWFRSIAKQGEIVRLAKRLANSRTGEDVAVYRHDLSGSDPFELQDQLAKYTNEIMGAIDKGISDRVDRLPIEQLNAWELIYTRKGNRKENIRRALALAPDLYSANSAVAADLFDDWYMQRTDDPSVAAEALRLARRGWELAPFDEYASEVAARVEIGVGSPARAVNYMKKFFDLKSVSSRQFYGALLATGQTDVALAHAEANPLVEHGSLAHIYLAAGRYAEAIEYYRKEAQRYPDNVLAWFNLANALGYMDRKDDIDGIFAGLKITDPKTSVDDWEKGVRRFWGETEFGDKLVAGLKQAGYQ